MNCPFCGDEVTEGFKYCQKCGGEMPTSGGEGEIFSAPSDLLTPESSITNSSGGHAGAGEPKGTSYVPKQTGGSLVGTFSSSQVAEISAIAGREAFFTSGNKVSDLEKVKGWNWGAFFFGWIWCLGNGLIEVGIGIFLAGFFYLGFIGNIFMGFMGNELAWKRKKFNSVEEFMEIQGKWSKAALLFFSLGLALVLIVLILAAAGDGK